MKEKGWGDGDHFAGKDGKEGRDGNVCILPVCILITDTYIRTYIPYNGKLKRLHGGQASDLHRSLTVPCPTEKSHIDTVDLKTRGQSTRAAFPLFCPVPLYPGKKSASFAFLRRYVPGVISCAILTSVPVKASTKGVHLFAIFIIPIVAVSAGILYSLLASNVAGYTKQTVAALCSLDLTASRTSSRPRRLPRSRRQSTPRASSSA